MPTVLFLVRHAAQVDLGQRLSGRSPGIALSPRGNARAAAVARRLTERAVAAIHSGPLERARAMAEAIGRRLGIGVEVVPAFEVDFGAWTGKRFDELAGDPAWDRWNRHRSAACPPGGETMAAAQQCAVSQVERAAAAHPGRAVVLVSHCDTLRSIVAHFLGLSLDHLLRFEIAPASVTTLEVGPWGARILSPNEKVAE